MKKIQLKSSRVVATVTYRILILVMCTLIIGAESAIADEWKRILDLNGSWRFEIGDDFAYADPDFDDSSWERIRVPGKWENQGFPGYDGFAWYRKTFLMPEKVDEHQSYLHLGYIDDVDEVYLNGNLIGYKGSYPQDYFDTAYDVFRQYLVPNEFLRLDDENVIAVRVYDDVLEGGIVRGDIGIFYKSDELPLTLNLAGFWKLEMGDDPRYSLQDFDDSKWRDVVVPGLWDNYGYKEYDGTGWYRTRFYLPKNLQGERLVLLLGKIDDVDQVYLNGIFIGNTGPWPDNPDYRGYYEDYYVKDRAYHVPPKLLYNKGENILAVRVFDAWRHGGIWDGPVGLVTRDQYLEWKESQPWQEKIWKLFKK